MKDERDYAAEIDSLQRSIRRLHVLMASAVLGLGVLALAGWSQKTGVLRASGLEIVDAKGAVRASIKTTRDSTFFKLAGGGPPNGKGMIPTAEWWLGINVNSLHLTDETGSVDIQPYRISLDDPESRITLERPLPLSDDEEARIEVKSGQKVSTFPGK